MATLVLKGHSTRGVEVIQLLVMLSAKSQYTGTFKGFYYWIEDGQVISSDIPPENSMIFSLEEFFERFPYKVGEKVRVWSQHDDEFFYGSYSCESKTIKSIQWNKIRGKVAYTIEGIDRVFYKEELIPYKEEVNMKDNKVDLPLKGELYDDNRITYLIPDGYEVSKIENSEIILQKKKSQYPKTYKECCNILGIEDRENGYCGYEYELLGEFQKLYICRNAYWKIAGEELGLGKPWEPDFTNNDEERYGIYTLANKVERDFCGVGDVNMVLSFPTEEMRDIFYKNFMDLIEGCKKLL